MLNPFTEVNWHPDRAGRRTFARSLIIGFPIVAAVGFVVGLVTTVGFSGPTALAVAGVGAGIGLILFALPGIAWPFYVVWYAVACAIGIVVGNVLLGLVYYVAVTGVGLILRLLGRHPLRVRVDRAAATYWQDAGPTPPPGRYYKQS